MIADRKVMGLSLKEDFWQEIDSQAKKENLTRHGFICKAIYKQLANLGYEKPKYKPEGSLTFSEVVEKSGKSENQIRYLMRTGGLEKLGFKFKKTRGRYVFYSISSTDPSDRIEQADPQPNKIPAPTLDKAVARCFDLSEGN